MFKDMSFHIVLLTLFIVHLDLLHMLLCLALSICLYHNKLRKIASVTAGGKKGKSTFVTLLRLGMYISAAKTGVEQSKLRQIQGISKG